MCINANDSRASFFLGNFPKGRVGEETFTRHFAIGSTAYRAGGSIDEAKYIYITTDSETGEFSAIVPPIRYRVESVKFPNNSALESNELFMNVPAINMTNPRDSVIPDTLYTEDRTPLPLFRCNKKLMLTYRSNPVMDITQMGAPIGAFGTDTILVHEAHQDIKLPAYSYDEETHSATYNYGYPVFEKGRTYEFKVRAYEPYLNYDAKVQSVLNDVALITCSVDTGDWNKATTQDIISKITGAMNDGSIAHDTFID